MLTSPPSAQAALNLRTVLVSLAIVGLVVVRRIRPQRVKPWRSVSIAVLVTLASAFSLLSTGRPEQEGGVLLLAPLFLIPGIWLGLKLMSTVTFWRDEGTGALWMKGGVVYVAVWLGALALRIGLRAGIGHLEVPAATAHHAMPEALVILSVDPIFLSVGLWYGRAAGVFKKLREPGA